MREQNSFETTISSNEKYPHMRMLRSDDDILADMLRLTAQGGEAGEHLTRLKQRSNLSEVAFKKRLGTLIDLRLINSTLVDDSRDFRRTFHLTEDGRRFLSVYEELVALMFPSWRESGERQVKTMEELVRAW